MGFYIPFAIFGVMMRLTHIPLYPRLKGLVEKLWVFESSRKPPGDMNLIVPNGLIKMVVPFRNGLSGKMEGWHHLSREHSITIIGMTDIPSVVEAEHDTHSGTIGIEFSPYGAYRFFNLKQNEIHNRIYPLDAVLGVTAKQLEEQIANTEDVTSKVHLLQQFLIKQLDNRHTDIIYEYCVQQITTTRGRITVKELEKQTGYSSRWLHMKFMDRAGISPKNLASIVRFQQFYTALAQNREKDFLQKEFYDFYYDQSHFIKDFKRFTGLPPAKLAMSENEFGKIFYKE